MTKTDERTGIALVTGAADRLGAALARTLAQAGYAVVIHYNTSAEKAQAFVDELKANGHEVAKVQADLTNRADRSRVIAEAASHFGPLNVLVNNASTYNQDDLATLKEDYWDNHFAIHAEAPLFLARDFAAQLLEGEKGNIINVIDERVLNPYPAALSYHLSKSALWTATQTLANQLAPRIRVNAIGPGPILPEAGQSQAAYDARSREALLGSNAEPSDAAAALLYLLSAQKVTGQMLAIDAGEHLRWPEWRGPTPRQS